MQSVLKIGSRVRSRGALYVHNVDGNTYRKVHEGTVIGVQKHTDMGAMLVCKVATAYGTCFVNPSQLVPIGL